MNYRGFLNMLGLAPAAAGDDRCQLCPTLSTIRVGSGRLLCVSPHHPSPGMHGDLDPVISASEAVS